MVYPKQDLLLNTVTAVTSNGPHSPSPLA